MSQPHPPIPQPQPHPATGPDGPHDEPRTQSILLPPGQRPAEQPGSAAGLGWERTTTDGHANGHRNGHVNGHVTASTAEWATAPAEPQLTGQQPAGLPPTGQLPAQAPAPDPAVAAQVTGPVDWAPGQPPSQPAGSTAAPLPPPPSPGPSTAPSTPSGGQRRNPLAAVREVGRTGSAALLPVALGVVALVLLELGLALDFGSQSLWEAVPTWSAFATLAALVVLVPSVARLAGRRLTGRTAWRAGASGVAGLAAFWVLVALPLVASDRGFWLTAALAAAGAALWLAPGRPE